MLAPSKSSNSRTGATYERALTASTALRPPLTPSICLPSLNSLTPSICFPSLPHTLRSPSHPFTPCALPLLHRLTVKGNASQKRFERLRERKAKAAEEKEKRLRMGEERNAAQREKLEKARILKEVRELPHLEARRPRIRTSAP